MAYVNTKTGELVEEAGEDVIWIEDDHGLEGPEGNELGNDDWLLAWYAKKLLHIEAEEAAIKAQFDVLKRQVAAKRKALEFSWGARAKARLVYDLSDSKKRSLETPYGRVGLRKSKAKLDVIDKEAALSWAAMECPKAVGVRMVKSLKKSELPMDRDIPGVETIPEGDTFYVKAPK